MNLSKAFSKSLRSPLSEKIDARREFRVTIKFLLPVELAVILVSPLFFLFEDLDDLSLLLGDLVLLGGSHAGAEGLAALSAVLRHVRADGLLRPVLHVTQLDTGVSLMARISLVVAIRVERTTMKLLDASLLSEDSRHVGWFRECQHGLEIVEVDLLLTGCEKT